MSRKTTQHSWPLVARAAELRAVIESLDDPARPGVLLYGATGVGRSRIAAEAVSVAAERGLPTVRLVGHRATRAMPMSAVAPMLPPELLRDDLDPVTVAARFRREQLAVESGRRQVVLADDIDSFDQASLFLLSHLVDSGAIWLVGTVNSETPTPELVTTLWSRSGLERIDLGPLDRAAFEKLLPVALGGPIGREVIQELWARTAGNPLFIRELVTGAVERGDLRDDNGVWTLTGPLVVPPRLQEVLVGRLTELPREARRVLAWVSASGGCSVSDLTAFASLDLLIDLERQALITVTEDQRREVVGLATALLGDVVLDGLTRLELRRLRGEIADHLAATGARRREDALRLASLHLDTGRPVDTDVLLRGLTAARRAGDAANVERLASGAWAQARAPRAALVLADALIAQGRCSEAEDLLADLSADDLPRSQRVAIAMMRVGAAITLTGAPQRPLELVDAALDELGPGEEPILLAARAWILGLDDDRSGLVGTTADPAWLADQSPQVLVQYMLSQPYLLTQCGHTEAALAFARAGIEARRRLPEGSPAIAEAVLLAVLLEVQYGRGEIDDVRSVGRRTFGDDWSMPHTARTDALATLGRACLLAGDVRAAERWFRLALSNSRVGEFRPNQRRSWIGLIEVLARQGHLAAARTMLDQVRTLDIALRRRNWEVALSSAAIHEAAGDLAAARRVLDDEIVSVRSRRLDLAEAHLRRAAHRIGGLEERAGHAARMAELAAAGDNPLVDRWARLLHADVAGDADALASIADECIGVGLVADAVDALEAAARVQKAEGRGTEAALARRRAAELAPAPAVPAPTASDPEEALVPATPLSAREREIAVLAAARVQSKEIASRLHLSVRTVNNHLQNVYVKLGVSSRNELAILMGGATA